MRTRAHRHGACCTAMSDCHLLGMSRADGMTCTCLPRCLLASKARKHNTFCTLHKPFTVSRYSHPHKNTSAHPPAAFTCSTQQSVTAQAASCIPFPHRPAAAMFACVEVGTHQNPCRCKVGRSVPQHGPLWVRRDAGAMAGRNTGPVATHHKTLRGAHPNRAPRPDKGPPSLLA
jgi:hypothetical protein